MAFYRNLVISCVSKFTPPLLFPGWPPRPPLCVCTTAVKSHISQADKHPPLSPPGGYIGTGSAPG